MTETFMIKKAMFKSTNMMRLQKLQQSKQMIIQQDVVRYQYLKDHYQLIAVDLSKQKYWNADSRAIPKIGFYGMLKTNWQVFNEAVLEFYKGTVKVLWIVKMVEYNKVNVKLSDSQLNKLKSFAKN